MVPQGFAHEFSFVSEIASEMYKEDQLYHKDSKRDIRYYNPILNIDWQDGT